MSIRRYTLILFASLASISLSAQTVGEPADSVQVEVDLPVIEEQKPVDQGYKVEISVGWGDQMFETLIWHEIQPPFGQVPDEEVLNIKQNYKYYQHAFLSGYFNVRKWFSLGLMLDFSGVCWETADYKGNGDFIAKTSDERFMNICLIPQMRFNYMNKQYVSLHTGFGLGMNVNTGTEKDYLGRQTVVAPAFYLDLIGVKACYKNFFGAVDLGGIISLQNQTEIYLLGSRMFSVSLGVQF